MGLEGSQAQSSSLVGGTRIVPGPFGFWPKLTKQNRVEAENRRLELVASWLDSRRGHRGANSETGHVVGFVRLKPCTSGLPLVHHWELLSGAAH